VRDRAGTRRITGRTSLHCYVQKITPWGKVLLEKLTVPQLVKRFPLSFGVHYRVHNSATCLYHETHKSKYSHPISFRSILILSSYIRLGRIRFSHQYPARISVLSNTCHKHTKVKLSCNLRTRNKMFWSWISLQLVHGSFGRSHCLYSLQLVHGSVGRSHCFYSYEWTEGLN
jgi:hypothetical protein